MLLKEIIRIIEEFAPLPFQESYDNAGLLTGNREMKISGVLITVDTTEEIIEEAINKGCNLVLAHHPVIFKGLKSITGKNYVERVMIKAIKNDIAIYSAHTNLDNVKDGVNGMIAGKIGLKKCEILAPKHNELMKLVTFVPLNYAEEIRTKVFESGAGTIGNYDSCSFNLPGKGTFRGNDNTDPFVGEKGKIHQEEEIRIETVFPKYLRSKVIKALISAHPYEEVAYDLYPIENKWDNIGMGMTGFLSDPMDENSFLDHLKNVFGLKIIRHTNLLRKKINKVALCGGSGSFLLRDAIASGADIFITGDFKYHEFFDAEDKIVIADIGHYESEQFTKDVFYELLTKKIPNFAVTLAETNTNPVNYY